MGKILVQKQKATVSLEEAKLRRQYAKATFLWISYSSTEAMKYIHTKKSQKQNKSMFRITEF